MKELRTGKTYTGDELNKLCEARLRLVGELCPRKDGIEYEEWWKSLTMRQKIAEFERWLACPCNTCSLFRELVGEERIRSSIEKMKQRIEKKEDAG